MKFTSASRRSSADWRSRLRKTAFKKPLLGMALGLMTAAQAFAGVEIEAVDPNAPSQIGKTCSPASQVPYFRTVDSEERFLDAEGRPRRFHVRELLECYLQDCVVFYSDGSMRTTQESACTVLQRARWEIFQELADTSEPALGSTPPNPEGSQTGE